MFRIETPAKSHDQGLTLKYGQYTTFAFNDVHFDDRLLYSMKMPDQMNWVRIYDMCIGGSFILRILLGRISNTCAISGFRSDRNASIVS